MPKVSFASKDAVDVSMGIQEGPVEIIGAVVRVHQYPPNKTSGEQGEPFPCVQLTFAKLNNDGEKLDEDPVKMEFGIGKLDKFHPGNADGADDNEPEDAGTDVDTEGNCICATDENNKLNKKCKWMIFIQSLEDKGFKPEILANGYMPDIVGLKAVVATRPGIKIPGQDYKRDPTVLVVDKVIQFPYDKKKAGKSGGGGGKGAGAASKPAAAPATSNGSANGSVDEDIESLTLATLGEVAAEMTGKQGVERKKLQTLFQTRLMRNHVPVKQHKPAIELVKSDEWLTAVTTERDDTPVYGLFMVEGDLVNFA